jgi:hypothetical protein
MEADRDPKQFISSADIWEQIDPALLEDVGTGGRPAMGRLGKKVQTAVLARIGSGDIHAMTGIHPRSRSKKPWRLFAGTYSKYAAAAAAIVLVILGGWLFAGQLGLFGIPAATTTAAATYTEATTAATCTEATTASTTCATSFETTGQSGSWPIRLVQYLGIDFSEVRRIRIIRFDQDGIEQSRIITSDKDAIQEIGQLIGQIELDAGPSLQTAETSYEISFSMESGPAGFTAAASLVFQGFPDQVHFTNSGSFTENLNLSSGQVLCNVNADLVWQDIAVMLEHILAGPK